MKLFNRKQARHSQFDLESESVTAWVNRLPRANLPETGKQLYRALVELSELECGFKQRLEVLEALRPSINLVLRGLRPRYLNASIVLPEKTQTVVRFCDALNQRLVNDYRRVSSEILARNWVSRYKMSLALSLHRELSEYSQLLLRRYNLYQSEDDVFWQRIHTCYRVACQYRLMNIRIIDNDYGHCTLERAYLRPMLFVCAHPYQLTQQFQIKLHENLHQLCEHTHIHESDPRKYCFMFDPAGDHAPIYQELCDNAEGWLGIDTTELVNQISRQLQTPTNIKAALPQQLCRKLLRAWSSITDRIEQRYTETQKLEIAVGLPSTHFFVAGEQPFEAFTKETDEIDDGAWLELPGGRESSGNSDVAIEVIDYSNLHQEKSINQNYHYRHFLVHTVNNSRNGYCISWPARESNQLRNGDVICVRETDAPCWSVGCIRWIKKHTEDELHAGISILSHAAESYIARKVGGGAEYRALLLGAESVSGKPKSILLPNVSLPVESELELTKPTSEQLHLHLKSQIQQTRDFALYDYGFGANDNQTRRGDDAETPAEEWEFT